MTVSEDDLEEGEVDVGLARRERVQVEAASGLRLEAHLQQKFLKLHFV